MTTFLTLSGGEAHIAPCLSVLLTAWSRRNFLLCRLFGSSTFVSSSILGKQNTLPSPYRSFLVTSRRWSTGCRTCQSCQCWALSCSLLWVRARFHGWSLPNSSPRVHAPLPCPLLCLSTGRPTSLLVLASQPWRYCAPRDLKCLLRFHVASSYHILKQSTHLRFIMNSIQHLKCVTCIQEMPVSNLCHKKWLSWRVFHVFVSPSVQRWHTAWASAIIFVTAHAQSLLFNNERVN